MPRKDQAETHSDKAKKKEAKAARKAEKKARKKHKKLAPRDIATGKGPAPIDIGRTLLEMFNKGQFAEIEEMFWSPKITSIEGLGVSKAWKGRKAVEAKNTAWLESHTIHAATAEGPFVGATGFAVKFKMDIEDTAAGTRETMEEIGVYRIKNGKIVEEEFMYRA